MPKCQSRYSSSCQDGTTYHQTYFDFEKGEYKEQPTNWIVDPFYQNGTAKLRFDYRRSGVAPVPHSLQIRDAGMEYYPFALVLLK